MCPYYVVLVAGVAVIAWLVAKKADVKWYEWLLGLIGWVLAMYAFYNFGASYIEVEPRAGGLLLLIFGVPALIFLLVAFFLARGRKKA
jgi:uncharacterized membrane protein